MDKLRSLAAGIILFGQISEFHLDNLSKFPFYFFEDIQEVKLEHFVPNDADIAGGSEFPKITYTITFKESPRMDSLDKRLEAIENSVKTLLWSNTVVTVLDGATGKPLKEVYGR